MQALKRILFAPSFWLIVQAVVLAVVMARDPGLTLYGPEQEEDAKEYVELGHVPFREGLASYRTLAYPYFLRALAIDSTDGKAFWWVHGLWHLACVLVFYSGLRRVLASKWLAFAAASSLLYSNVFLWYGTWMLTDAPASSAAILTLALMFWLIDDARRLWAWLAFAAALFVTYQLRPSYLFLIGLLPVLAFLLRGLVKPRPGWWRWGLVLGGGLAFVGIVPFVGFCQLRSRMVGDFGLVSFDGYNLAGVATQFLAEDLVSDLPERVQPLANEILLMRARVYAGHLPEIYRHRDPDSLFVKNRQAVLREHRVSPEARSFIDELEDKYGALYKLVELLGRARDEEFRDDRDQWAISVAAAETLAPGQNPVVINRMLGEYARAVLKFHRRAYAKYALRMFLIMTVLTLFNGYLFLELLAVLFVLALVQQGLWLLRRLRGRDFELSVEPVAAEYKVGFAFLALVSLAFTGAQLIVLAVLAQPLPRYTDAAGVLLPTVAVAGLFVLCDRIRRDWRAGKKRTKLNASHGSAPSADQLAECPTSV